jgi:hypothetical protein
MPKTDGLTDKLHALSMLAKYTGLVDVGPLGRTEEAINAANRFVTDDLLVACFVVILDSGAHPVAKAACAALISFRFPDWRKHMPESIVGYVVDRGSPEVAQWRRDVFSRDGHACRKCGARESLHAHHIARWADCPELRIVVDNGLTLCQTCHMEEHHGRVN